MQESFVSGDKESGQSDGGNPVKTGGVARTTNPTAVDDGDRVGASFDDVGRQLMLPVQVRDLLATASATLTSGTAASLLAGAGSGVFTDLIHATFANNSTATANIQLLQDGTVIKNIQVPAGNTFVFEPVRPIPAQTANTRWSVDMEDITGTTVFIDALFSKEV